ncbi:NAD-dependent epimerase/dehydratase family protein [Streptomyces phaeochromogenes]|uniref:NAD-dependent epimerase/dehydratase family protein n=1 Tax=Streptomyces phaeochromogenes TaxID=1923 RepID=UPI0033D234D4
MSASRAVVTGGSGFIGGHLVDRLLADGWDVTVFDGTPPGGAGAPEREHVRHITGDVRDAGQLEAAVKGTDTVFHLAGVVGVDQYLARPLDVIDVNVSGTRNALSAAARAGARVVVASTSEIFGRNPSVPWREDSDRVLGPTTADRWVYSSSKALCEHLTFAFVRQHGLHATVVRYFNVYGPRQRPAFVVSRNVHRALNGRPLLVYDQGDQTRCFTYVDDAVEGTVRAALSPRAMGEAFNIGSMTEITVREVVDLIAALTGSTAVITPVDTARALGPAYQDLRRRIPDATRMRELLGWSCGTTLRDGLTRTIEWARAHPQWLAIPDSGADDRAQPAPTPVRQSGGPRP